MQMNICAFILDPVFLDYGLNSIYNSTFISIDVIHSNLLGKGIYHSC